jgi:hypothetical protein
LSIDAAVNGQHPGPAAPAPHSPTPPSPGQLDPDQIQQLLRWIDPRRVISDMHGHATVAAQDVRAHLTRIFGYSGWRHEVADRELMFVEEITVDGVGTGKWAACYRVEVTLEVYNRRGELVTRHREGNMSTEYGRYKGPVMQRAYTSAISLALKRAAVALGDQFGLSLYNGGALRGVVGAVLGHSVPEAECGDAGDVQRHAPETRADEMDGVDPDSPAEIERMRAYQASRRAARGEPAVDVKPADDAQQRAWLAEEVGFLDRLTPGLAARIAVRLGVDDVESAATAELAAVVGPMRFLAALPLRKRGLHDAADLYQAADPQVVRPLHELLGCDPGEIV